MANANTFWMKVLHWAQVTFIVGLGVIGLATAHLAGSLFNVVGAYLACGVLTFGGLYLGWYTYRNG